MTQDRHEHLIIKFLSGSLTPEEDRELRLWLDRNPENRREFEEYQKVWRLSPISKELPDFKTGEEWVKLEVAIGHDQAPQQRHKTLAFRKPRMMAVAATVAFLVVSTLVFYLVRLEGNENLIVKESGDQRIHFVLPDGSEVWLNRESSLSYPEAFAGSERKVELKGEAFFDVRKNPEKAFIIHTEKAEVKVLGTSFYVKASEQADQTQVYVLSGKVSLAAGENPEERVILNPGETGLLDQTDLSLKVKEEVDINDLAWKSKNLIFNKTELQQVVKVLENYFSAEISVENPSLLQCRFSSSFQDPSIEEVLEVLKVALNLRVSKKGNVWIIDGEGC